MTAQQIHARLRKLEARVMPRVAPARIKLMAGPRLGADEAVRKAFEVELKAAQAEHDMVIVMTPLKPLATKGGGKVRYVPSELEAGFLMLASMPSTAGQGTALDDAIASARGNIFRPNPEAARGGDWDDA